MIKKILKGPSGVKLILDQSQIFPDDPGNGTPALVEYKRGYKIYTGIYWCCADTGDCDGMPLPDSVMEWLNSEKIESEVSALGC